MARLAQGLRMCPATGAPLQLPVRLVPNAALLEAIESWVSGHAYWPQVCHVKQR